MPLLGELAALGAAMAWTVSSASFAVASRRAGPAATNLFRLWMALPVLALLVFVTTGHWWPVATGAELGLLLLSGLVGLVIGDLGYFVALARLGPRLASVVMVAWPAFTLLLAPWTGDAFSGSLLLGVGLTGVGVVLVLLRARSGSRWNPQVTKAQWWWGIAGALLGACGQALGVVLSRQVLSPTLGAASLTALQATLVRMVAGVVGAQVLACVQRRPWEAVKVAKDLVSLRMALLGTAFGPVLGIWLSMLATQHAQQVGVASALMATTPLFMMPVAYWFYGARIGWLGGLGTLLAVLGAALLFLR